MLSASSRIPRNRLRGWSGSGRTRVGSNASTWALCFPGMLGPPCLFNQNADQPLGLVPAQVVRQASSLIAHLLAELGQAGPGHAGEHLDPVDLPAARLAFTHHGLPPPARVFVQRPAT